MLWVVDKSVSQWVSQWVRDVCISHQSDWIYYKQPIKFFVVKVNGMWEVVCEKILSSLFWVKKKKWQKEEKSAELVKQNRFPVAQGLDSPLACYERDESWVLKQLMS